MSAGELITGVCWLLLILGSVMWLAVGLVKVSRRRRAPGLLRRFLG